MAKISKKILNKLVVLLDKITPLYLILVMLNLNLPTVKAAELPSLGVQLPIQNGRVEVISPYPDDSGARIITKPAKLTVKVWVTAYNSLPEQTDNEPCIAASGKNICDAALQDIIATNYRYLPFGTQVRFPELFGEKVFTVEDRMHRKYQRTADIYMGKDYQSAIEFGKKFTIMEIL